MYERGESSFRGTSLSTRFWFVNARASRTSDSVRPTDAVEGQRPTGDGIFALGFRFPTQSHRLSGSGSPGGGGRVLERLPHPPDRPIPNLLVPLFG